MKDKLSFALVIAVAAALILSAFATYQAGRVPQYQRMGVTNLDSLHLAMPTDVGTATPGLMIQNSSVANSFEIRNASGTPVFHVDTSGAVNGKMLRYATANTQLVCGSDTITGTKAVVHGLTTPVYAICNLAANPTGDAQTCSIAISSSTVTIKVWQSALTPTANATGIATNWCVIGQ